LSAQGSPDARLEEIELMNSVADRLRKLESSVRTIPRQPMMNNKLVHRAERSRNARLAKVLQGMALFRGAEPVKHVLDEMRRLIGKSEEDVERSTGAVGDSPALGRSGGSSTS
jgi:hypothetical protein